MRRVSMAILAPEGYASGLPMENRLGWPYVARGLRNTKLASALTTADPKRAALLNQVKKERRLVFGSLAFVLIRFLLRGQVYEFFDVLPEDVILGFFEVGEVVTLDGKDEKTSSSETHEKARGKCEVGDLGAHLEGS
jgi:hypothetical protein